MAMPASLVQKWSELNYANQKQASSFIDFLLAQQQKTSTSSLTSKISFGVWKNESFYIAEDFDETPEDFGEYV